VDKDADTHVELAETIYNRDPASALWHARRAAELAPDDPVVLTDVSFVMFGLDEWDEAAELAEVASVFARDDFPRAAKLSWLLGVFALNREQLDDAEQHLARAAASDDDILFVETYADFLVHEQRDDEAVAVVEAAVRRNPDDRALAALHNRVRGLRRAGGTSTTGSPLFWRRPRDAD